MSALGKFLRKNTFMNHIMDELFVLKIKKRNFKARPIRKQQTIQAHKVLSKTDPERWHIFFLGTPMHKNLGDQTQRYCIEQWLKENYSDAQIIALPTWPFYDKQFCKDFLKRVGEKDMLVIQSGYCTTDRHFDHPMHLWIAKHIVDNKIVFMPQTVKFFVTRKGYASGKVFDKNPNILFLARDKTSCEMAKTFFPETRVELFPDIVTTLIGTKKYDDSRNGVFLCVRNDGEKKYSDEEILQLQKKIRSIGMKCDIGDTNSSLPVEQLIAELPQELDRILSEIASYQVVITDRYHGTIFSLIANTPVIVIPSNDHKVKTGTEWFKGVYDGSFFNADSPEQAYEIAEKLLKDKTLIENRPYFNDHYYKKLKAMI